MLPKLLSLKVTVKDLLVPTEFPKESKIVPEVICEVDEPSAGKVFGVAVKVTIPAGAPGFVVKLLELPVWLAFAELATVKILVELPPRDCTVIFPVQTPFVKLPLTVGVKVPLFRLKSTVPVKSAAVFPVPPGPSFAVIVTKNGTPAS